MKSNENKDLILLFLNKRAYSIHNLFLFISSLLDYVRKKYEIKTSIIIYNYINFKDIINFSVNDHIRVFDEVKQ